MDILSDNLISSPVTEFADFKKNDTEEILFSYNSVKKKEDSLRSKENELQKKKI